MNVEIEISSEEAQAIIAEHVRKNVLYHYASGKDIHVSSRSYSGLAAIVKICEPEPVDTSEKDA
jgi:hypothetical protein